MMSEFSEAITFQVPQNAPRDSLISVVGSDGFTYAVSIPHDSAPGSSITVLLPSRPTEPQLPVVQAQSNFSPAQKSLGAAALAGID